MANIASKSITEARASFSRLLDTVANEKQPVIISKGNLSVAAIIPMADFERLQARNNRSNEIKLHILMEEVGRYVLDIPDDEEFETRQAILSARAEMLAERNGISLGDALDELIAERRGLKHWTHVRDVHRADDEK